MIKTFKEFINDFKEYYPNSPVRITDELDMMETCYEMYGTDNFEIDYENKTLELFN